jgi:beta-galactosidase
MLHVEWGGDAHVGRHGIGPHVPDLPVLADHGERPGDAALSGGEARAASQGDWSESYILDLMEWHLRVQSDSAWLAGNAQWVFKDFGTPLRPENPIPYVNQKGLVDRAGRPKDALYLFKSYLSDEPTVFIESPTWTVRTGTEAEAQRLRVYSNCRRVELFLNGESLGVRNRDPHSFPAAGLVWQVRFRFGRNDLLAIGEHALGRTSRHSLTVAYEPQARGPGMRLISEALAVAMPGGERATRVTLQICDRESRPVVDDRRRISLRLVGPGRLLTHQGTVDGSHLVELANGRATVYVFAPTLGASELRVAVLDGPEAIVRITEQP